MRSFKLISRGVAAVLLMSAFASAQLMNGKSFDVIRVEKVGISAGKIDSLAKMLGEQQFRGKKLNDEMMTQLRYAVIDNLVGQELIKLECKKQKQSEDRKHPLFPVVFKLKKQRHQCEHRQYDPVHDKYEPHHERIYERHTPQFHNTVPYERHA